MDRKKIIGITAARSEYDLMYSVYKTLTECEDFDFGLILTGPHLSSTFGLTKQHVLDDGFKIVDTCFNLVDSDEKIARVISIGNQIPMFAQTFYREKPDLILTAGDREDVMSACLCAAYMGIPLAHFFGGDIAKDGNVDNSVRYAASKFANIHFTTLKEHRDTLIKLGEDDWRIHVVGNPGIDRLMSESFWSKSELLQTFDLGHEVSKKYGVVIKHSIVSEVDEQGNQMRIILDSLIHSELFYFINYPNSDSGSYAIREVIDSYCVLYPEKFYKFKNLDRERYVNLLRHASVLIGNSSSGLLEAPSLKLPVINIGRRQQGRVHGQNVLFIEHNNVEIISALDVCLNDQAFLRSVRKTVNPYGQGDTAAKVLNVIRNLDFSDRLLYKDITY